MQKYLDFKEAKCKNCYKCLKICPVKAIKIEDNQAKIIEDKCILCGKLIHVDCSHIDEIQEHVSKHHNFSVDKSRIVLYGTCSECMGENYEKNN